MRINEIMSAPVRTIGPEESAAAAWEAMRLHRVRHLVVVAGDEAHVLGVVSASDLGGDRGEGCRSQHRVSELMTERVVVAHMDTTVREAANLMRGQGVTCLPVFDGRRLKGIVTALDLLELIGRGAERPMSTATRQVLKNRGTAPRQAMAKNHPKHTSR